MSQSSTQVNEIQKALIVYFSGTGNTRGVAMAYSRVLETMGYQTLVRSLEDYLKGSSQIESDLLNVELLAIGGPIYAGNMPDLLINWVRQALPKSEKGARQALVFSTSAGLENAHGIHSIGQKLSKKGYSILGQQAYVMPRNFYVDKYPPTPLADQERLWQQMPGLVASHLEASFSSVPPAQLRGMGGLGVLGIDLMADLFRMMAKGMGKDYKATEGCVACGVCVRGCPRGNISLEAVNGSPEKRAHFGGKCMLCTRCIHQCPYNAITYKGKKIEQYRVPAL